MGGARDWWLLGTLVRSGHRRFVQPAQRRQARFLVPAGALTFTVTQIQVPTLVFLMGAEHAGLYRAMQLPMTAVGQIITAAATMALPRLAESFSAGDLAGVARRTRALVLVLLAICVGAEACLVFAHEAITLAMFGGKFVESSWLMPLIGLVAVTSCWGTALGVALLAMRESRTQLITCRDDGGRRDPASARHDSGVRSARGGRECGAELPPVFHDECASVYAVSADR